MTWGFPLGPSFDVTSLAVRVAALLAAAITHAGGDEPDTVTRTADSYITWVTGNPPAAGTVT